MTKDRSDDEVARDLRPTVGEDEMIPDDVPDEPPQADWGEETVFVRRERISVFWLTDVSTEETREIREFPCTIGRHPDADYPTRSGSVSRDHARIEDTGDGSQKLRLRDMDSLNGTYVNGSRIQECAISDGDKIRVGDVVLRFNTHHPLARKRPRRPRERPTRQDIVDGPVPEGTISMPAPRRRRAGEVFGDLVDSAAERLAQFGTILEERLTRIWPDAERYYAHLWLPAVIAAIVAVPIVWLILLWEVTPNSGARTPAGVATTLAPLPVSRQETTEPAPPPAADPTPQANTEPGPAPLALVEAAPAPGAAETTAAALPLPREASPTADRSPPTVTLPVAPPSPAPQPAAPRPAPTQPQAAAVDDRLANLPPVERATMLYRSGSYVEAIRELRAPVRDGDGPAIALLSQLQAAHDSYTAGQSEFEAGNKDVAFQQWRGFLEAEHRIFPDGRRSVYADEVTAAVVEEFTASGNKASEQNRWHDAYAYWRKAAELSPRGDASRSLRSLLTKAESEYAAGYRLEQADLQRAIGHWRETVQLLPPGTEYHIRAKAKLRLYGAE